MTKIAVRDGKLVVPFCPECGCRLGSISEGLFLHFFESFFLTNKDARGCSCSLIGNKFFVIDGRVTPAWV